MQWAPRWANPNLGAFTTSKIIFEPYETDEMCKFITTVPEHYLADRKIQIEYSLRNSLALSKIPWQEHYPFNLTNFSFNKLPYNILFKLKNKSREFFSNRFIRRNWELQLLGNNNQNKLYEILFFNKKLNCIIPEKNY